jgi:hypothetical protein
MAQVTEIQDIAIDPVIPGLRFRCNVNRCKGACCTIPGGRGAPLLDSEVTEIQGAFPAVRKHLSERHLQVIEERGMFEGEAGNLVTTCVDNEACVFVTYERDIARCSFEKAFLAGEIGWRKPLSCHLFPIRIDRGLQEQIRFEYLEHCRHALDEGAAVNMLFSDFAGDALIRAYGEEWYRRFREYCRSHLESDDSRGTVPWQP